MKETLGQLVTNIEHSAPEAVHLEDSQVSRAKEFIDNVLLCVENGKKLFDGDFYCVTTYKNEHTMKRVFRHIHFPTKDCPTPTWDQTVYKYHRKDDHLEFIWTIPDPKTCTYLSTNALLVPADQKELLQFVLEFHDGTLDKRAMLLNGLKPDVILTTKEVE